MWLLLGIPAVLVCMAVACLLMGRYLNEHQRRYPVVTATAGWVYFIGGETGPIKVGMSSHEPSKQRLPELGTMSPIPLRIIFKAPVTDRFAVERMLHEALAPYREHGEWFDRDVALAYADHLIAEMAKEGLAI